MSRNNESINLQDVIEYFNHQDGCQEITRDFIYRIHTCGFDSCISNILAYSLNLWANAKPGTDSGYASIFVMYLLNDKQRQ